MGVPEKQRKYVEKNIKRVPLDMQKEEYERLKKYCDQNGTKINTFIKSLLAPYIERAD